MQLVEQHVIGCNDPRYAVIDAAAFASKNLYNAALYIIRQAFIHEGKRLDYHAVERSIRQYEAYKALPAKVSQQVLQLLNKNWTAFFEALDAYKEDPSKFTGRPRLPKYKHKTEGRNILVYTVQAISRRVLKKRGRIQPSKLSIEVQTRQKNIDQVRIVPKKGYYVVEVVYEKAPMQAPVNPAWCAGIDTGVNNLAALASNKPGFQPVIVNGRPVKSINQFYNKRRAELQHKLGHTGTTRGMECLTTKRNRRIDHYLHTTSKHIIDLLVEEGIGTLVIGKNPLLKQESEMGKRNNQNFAQIPHARFIKMLKYKAELTGIRVRITEESYTSKASFLDGDELPTYDLKRETEPTFSGKRVTRWLYRASDGHSINADVQAAYNIIRKVAPKAFQQRKGVEDGKGMQASLVVHPSRMVRVNPYRQKRKSLAAIANGPCKTEKTGSH